jgi:MFS family permease
VTAPSSTADVSGPDGILPATRLRRSALSRATGKRPRLVTPAFLTIAVATLAYFTADGVLIPVVPLYVEGPLGGGDVAVGLAVGAFSFTALLLRPWAGGLGDRRGRRRLMVTGAAIFGLSALAYVVADSVPLIVAARALTGCGEAFFFVGAAAAIADIAPPERRGEAVSFFSLSLYLGIGWGPPIGEAVLGETRFDAVWMAALAFAALAVLLSLRVPETRPEMSRTGSAGSRRRLIHPAGILPGFVLLTGVWGMAGLFSFVPLYATEIGLSGSRYVFVVFSAVVILIRSVGARLPDVLGARRAAGLALFGEAAGLTIMALWREPAGLYVGALVMASGVSLAFPALASLALSGAPDSERGSVLGTFTMAVDLGFGIGPVTLGVVAAAVGYPGSFLAAAGAAAVGVGVLLALGTRPSLSTARAEPPAAVPEL